MHTIRHFIDFTDLTREEHNALVSRAIAVKGETRAGVFAPRLAGQTLFMLFEKPSTRTRASFCAAMTQAGGAAVELAVSSLQIGRGETVADTARVLSSYGAALMIRANRHDTITQFAAAAGCPVINGLSDVSHPCQVLADVMTYRELRGDIAGKTIAWIGDCNNMLYSWAQAAVMFGCRLQVSCPDAYRRDMPGVVFCDAPEAAAAGAALVMTDVWTSMGDDDGDARRAAFDGYCVSAAVMAAANSDALFMHCLPAHRGEEVTAEVIDGEQSAVWRQAENRLHAQKALLLLLLGAND